MKKILFVILVISILLSSSFFAHQISFISLNPDTIITNNNVIDYYESLNKINNEISQDNYNYSFKKEEITENLSGFKIEYINTLNQYISDKKYKDAKNYLDQFYHLFIHDTQINSIKNYLINMINLSNLNEYCDSIEILSFAPLISYPNMILNKKNSSASRIDENHITTDEFKKILLSLYEKNYILVSMNDINFNNNNAQILAPKGKKPVVLILEDISYNTKENGGVEKLIIDNNDNIATYTPKRSINDRIEHDNDFITILENFLDTHPSFSYNNAKATLVVDGSTGIFGYNTQKSNATSKYQLKKAIEIITKLQSLGYIFASRGYGANINSPYINFVSSLNTWNNELKPILNNNTNIFFLESSLLDDNEDFNNKMQLLHSYGYTVIIAPEMDYKCQTIQNMTYISAKQINGKTLRYCQESFSHLFDSEYVYDHINRHITFNS